MCKYCEVENREVLCDDGYALLYIMNNLGGTPQLVYSTGERGRIEYQPISYCPICGTRLASFENLQTTERGVLKNEN